MDELKGLSLELEAVYPELKDAELRDEVLKQVMREKIELSQIDRFSYESVVLKFKKHTNWKWKDEFIDSLYEEAKLPLAVTVNKSMEKRFELEEFRVDNGHHIRLYPTRSKAKTEQKNLKIEALTEEFSALSLEDLVVEYKINKMDYQLAEEQYETLKKKLFNSLRDTNSDSFGCSLGNYKIVKNDPKYDISNIHASTITKNVTFVYKAQGSDATVYDLYNGYQFSFSRTTTYEEHTLTCQHGQLYIDGEVLVPFDGLSAMNKKMKKVYEPLVSEGYQFVTGSIEIEGEDFFRHCPLSSTKVTELMNQGIVDPKSLEKYRYIDSLDDIDVRFEVIDEETEAERKVFFLEQLVQRSETIRERNATTVTL